MTEADQLLHKIRKAAVIVGEDTAGRVVMELVLQDADAERLMALGEDAAESVDSSEDKPYRVPRASVCWLEAAEVGA